MRCATPVTFWAAATSGGSPTVQVDALSVGPEGATCTGSQYVVVTQAEFDYATVSPFRLSNDEASSLASAVLLLWGLAFGIRMVIRVLRESDPTPDDL